MQRVDHAKSRSTVDLYDQIIRIWSLNMEFVLDCWNLILIISFFSWLNTQANAGDAFEITMSSSNLQDIC